MKSVLLSRVSILLAAIVIIGVGCRKLDHSSSGTSTTVITPEEQEPEAVAGKGGMASFRIIANHQGLNIDSTMVYIKYNTSVVPFNVGYDDSVWAKQIDDIPVATFTGLKTGNYYIFASGWDLVRSLRVEGGLPYTITEDTKATTFTLTLPVAKKIN